jgi:wobble nucleotide-excising tRNase
MIEQIDINSFGIYKDYQWSRTIGNDFKFGETNIIFGRNYSGKTTLSRVFRCLETKLIPEDFDNPSFIFHCSNGNNHQESMLTSFTDKVRVYNTDFMNENLKWFYSNDGKIEPFTVIGQPNIELDEQINQLNAEIGSIDSKSGKSFESEALNKKFIEFKSDTDDFANGIETKLRNKARAIKEDTHRFNSVGYQITYIKKDIEDISKTSVSSPEQIELATRILQESEKPPIKQLGKLSANLDELKRQVQEISQTQLKPTKELTELVSNTLIENWVKQGMALQNDFDVCSFCGNPIDSERWHDLRSYYNQESEELTKKIDALIQKVKVQQSSINQFISLNLSAFYETLHPKLQSCLERWNTEIAELDKQYAQFIECLESRKSDIFRTIEVPIIQDNTDQIFAILNDIDLIITEHNRKSTTLSSDKASARNTLRLDEVRRFIGDISYHDDLNKLASMRDKELELKDKAKAVSAELNELKQKKQELESQKKDESLGAKKINVYLEKFFGHNALSIEALGEAPAVEFKIMRNSVEAKNLSEGEISLISFCYFMAKIEDDLSSDTIVYIDDPISSLDNNHIFFVFSLIEAVIAKPKNYKQLFISTHNLDFLKYIKRLTSKNKNTTNYYLIERLQKGLDASSRLDKMPHHLRDFITEFNYLFNEIFQFTKQARGDRASKLENTYTKVYDLPNNMRKFLEYYLFYKYPNKDSPLSNLDKLFDNEVPVLISRVIQEGSHLTTIDRGWKPYDVQELETCAQLIIDKIRTKDIEQFHALLESIGERERTNEVTV